MNRTLWVLLGAQNDGEYDEWHSLGTLLPQEETEDVVPACLDWEVDEGDYWGAVA